MQFKHFAPGGPSPGSVRRYRWVLVWLGSGCAVALLLLANTIRNYTFVSRVLATQQVGHQISLLATQIEQEVRRDGLTADTLQKTTSDNPHEGASLTLKDPDNSIVEHLGVTLPFAGFSMDQEHAAFSRHEPLIRTIATSNGDYIVQAFPVRVLPRPAVPAPSPGAGPRPQMILEIGLPLKNADPAVLGPVRRNLIINCVAAISLLATVLLAWVGLRSYEQGRRFEEQIEIAREVQSRLLPSPLSEWPGYQTSTEYKPSEQVGGDFYDLFPIQKIGLGCLIGDVSGKGIPAALLMGVIHGAVRTADWQGSQAEHELASRHLNRLLCDRASDHRFASMFWCVYDRQQGTLRYVNAGHCPPLLITRRGDNPRTVRLDKGGPVLGLLPEATYEAATVDVSGGDLLVMYSDGLVEANNAQGEEYGEDRVSDLLTRNIEETPAQLRERLLGSLAAFASADVPQDDLTLVLVRFGQV